MPQCRISSSTPVGRIESLAIFCRRGLSSRHPPRSSNANGFDGMLYHSARRKQPLCCLGFGDESKAGRAVQLGRTNEGKQTQGFRWPTMYRSRLSRLNIPVVL